MITEGIIFSPFFDQKNVAQLKTRETKNTKDTVVNDEK